MKRVFPPLALPILGNIKYHPARVGTLSLSMCCASTQAPSSKPGYSETKGETSLPILDELVGYYINIQARRLYYNDFLRVDHQSVQWSFGDIKKNSEGLAHGLLQVGLRPGERILAIQPSNSETLIMQLACAKIGVLLCIVPYFKITVDKLRYYLNEFQPTVLLGREWLTVPEVSGGTTVEKSINFWDIMYKVVPELGLTYPGQLYNWTHSQEFHFLKKCFITDHNMKLISESPTKSIQVWGPFAYYEQRIRRLSALLHPDDPILALEDPQPALEDKLHVVYSHRNCTNAGLIFANIMMLKPGMRFGVMPNHHIDPIGSILAPYAVMTSGAVAVHLHDNIYTSDHAASVIERISYDEVVGIMGVKADFDLLIKRITEYSKDMYESLRWVCLFENGIEEVIPVEYLKKLKAALLLDDVYVFRGTMDTCYLTSYRTLSGGYMGMVSHCNAKVTGDMGTSDAKVLSRGNRGNLKLKGPHITGSYYNNAGILTELIDEGGWVSTSREAVISNMGEIKLFAEAQIY